MYLQWPTLASFLSGPCNSRSGSITSWYLTEFPYSCNILGIKLVVAFADGTEDAAGLTL